VRDILIYGFKRSFFPGSYLEKRRYVRGVIDFADGIVAQAAQGS
jgi:adenosine deaminase